MRGCLNRFAADVRGLKPLDETRRLRVLGLLVYDAARVRARDRAIRLLALMQACHPQVANTKYVYSNSGDEGDLVEVLSQGMRLQRHFASPMDENAGLEDFGYNIASWTAADIEELDRATVAERAELSR